MNVQKFNPLNWFKRHSPSADQPADIPVQRHADAREHRRESPLVTRSSFEAMPDDFRPFAAFDDFLNFGAWPTLDSLLRWQDGTHGKFVADDQHYYWQLPLPGFSENEIRVELHQPCLRVEAEHEPDARTDGWRHYRCERRQLNLPDDAKVDQIDAALRHGLLTIRIGRQASTSKPKRIAIH